MIYFIRALLAAATMVQAVDLYCNVECDISPLKTKTVKECPQTLLVVERIPVIADFEEDGCHAAVPHVEQNQPSKVADNCKLSCTRCNCYPRND